MTQMRWLELLSTVRLGTKKHNSEQARSPFHKDYDRIIFSQSFRQLNRKTQVHPLSQHDGIHTRLTHSLEVSCIGRSLGMLTAEKIQHELPMWISPADVGAIIQAACLAHDIGNPPFGHAGEYAIREWFDDASHTNFLQDLSPEQQADVRQFEGNAQGLRLLSKIDYHPYDGGMRLTYATLGAYLKYPWLSKTIAAQGDIPASQRAKFGCYQSEKDILQQIAQQLGLIQLGDYHYCRHPLTYLLEAADDICYALIDLEDGITLQMLTYAEVEPIFLNLIGEYPQPEELAIPNTTWQQKIAALRGRVMKRLVEEVSSAFAKHHFQILSGQLKGSLLQYCSPDIELGIEDAKQLARTKIFQHPQKSGLEIIAHESLQHLLNAFIPLTTPGKSLSFKENRLMTILHHAGADLGEQHYDNIMQVLDVISKFSDHQAYQLAQELQGNKIGFL
ncbi:deoxyguanosinetriphosphate triphosphohydrolase [Acinetobacter rudis]|uniref:Deoxyguanosinetriphosphate triphosphohydrolase n=1 Tax=Acinetobacter rudis TaxID=632955 RepID=A0AAW8J7C0_9GAMM|nr:deoxyguanosinetriphosphate triphosphohydrolase [Acinetobacter rudis]MDQ8935660.1 deoxyguanosinetriphosphate triphosphohydrolase [Acinetobacter rudis]MDQ8952069.1 deoxyguanosinetriphosphate triphosphohydrolase [Acinetobacter rudis]MDQ9017923.1 deoxyguanosinetriphosphate triphosphohydrolase [Acinetobacter rudis]